MASQESSIKDVTRRGQFYQHFLCCFFVERQLLSEVILGAKSMHLPQNFGTNYAEQINSASLMLFVNDGNILHFAQNGGEITSKKCVSGIWTRLIWLCWFSFVSSQFLQLPHLPQKYYLLQKKHDILLH